MEDPRAQEAGDAPPNRKKEKRAKRNAVKQARLRDAKKAHRSAAEGGDSTLEQLMRSLRHTLVEVDQPVVLISQAPRSGGTLLRNLFDGHSQCHVHPYEWHFGPTRRYEWPTLKLDATPERWWSKLVEDSLRRRFANGVRLTPTKGAHVKDAGSPSELYQFLLPPGLHRELFIQIVRARDAAPGEREILNSYLTALFNAWLNNHTLDNADKRLVVAFAPRLAWGDSLGRFFAAYPDGHLVSILRGPESWLASARGRQLDGADNNKRLIAMWKRSTSEMLTAKAEFPEPTTIVRFDDLVLDTERTMRMLASELGIDFEPILTEPTFNSRPIGPNSSYQSQAKQGIITSPLNRHKQVLTEAERARIAEACGPLYEEALKLADRPAHPSEQARELQETASS